MRLAYDALSGAFLSFIRNTIDMGLYLKGSLILGLQ